MIIEHLKAAIKNAFEEAFAIAHGDLTKYLINDNYDVITVERFILRAKKINQNLKEADKLAIGNKVLQTIKDEYSQKLNTINEYLEKVKSVKKAIERHGN